MADVTVDQAKLVMNAFASTFQNNLVTADLVTWKEFDGEMNDRNGLTVVEQVGPRYAVTETTDGVANLASGVQDTVFGSEQFKVNKTFGSSMGWGDFVKIRDIGAARESTALKNAALNLAEKIDAYVLSTTVLASNTWLGIPGNDIADWDDFVQGYTRLKEYGVDDSDLRGVLTYADKQALGEFVIDLPAPDGLSTNSFRQGFTGQIGGIPTLFTQQLPAFKNGNDVTGVTLDGGNQTNDYVDVAISGAPGQYLSQTVNLTGFTANTGTLNPGSVFTLDTAGGVPVLAYDNRLGAANDFHQEFTVLPNTAPGSNGVYTADGSGDIVARIFPALVVPNTGSGGNVAVNTANATVNIDPGAGATVTFKGAADTVFKPRAIIQKEAVVVNTAQLILPATGKAQRQSLTKVPLSVRMWMDSDFDTGEHKVRFDVALTANVRDRRRIVRINGN